MKKLGWVVCGLLLAVLTYAQSGGTIAGTVLDKAGKAIDNLAAKDFTITEDGVPQTMSRHHDAC